MARPLKEIEQELMNLSHQERARIAHALIVSLNDEEERLPKAEREALWLEEIKRRDTEIERGEVQPIPAEEVMRRAYGAVVKGKK
jgi:putative addiction module component (TIGR02574 family)